MYFLWFEIFKKMKFPLVNETQSSGRLKKTLPHFLQKIILNFQTHKVIKLLIINALQLI